MENKFTWLPFYKELSDWLLGKQNSQPELISKLKEIGITGFRDGTEKGKEITGLERVDYLDAGVRRENGKAYTNGGRVLNLVARADTLEAARQVVYENAQKVDFAGKTYRKDIGADAV